MSKRYIVMQEIQTRLMTIDIFKNAVYIGKRNRISGNIYIEISPMDSTNLGDTSNEFNISLNVFHTSSEPEKAIEYSFDDEDLIKDAILDDGILEGKCISVEWKDTNFMIDLKTMYVAGIELEFTVRMLN